MGAREELAIVINRSFYGMQAGNFEGYTPDFNAGDDQLAFDILAAGYRKMPDREAVIRALAEADEQSDIEGSWKTMEYMYSPSADAILALMEGNK